MYLLHLAELQTPRKYAITHLYKDIYKSKDANAQWGYLWEMDQVTAAVHGFTTYDAHLLPTILLLLPHSPTLVCHLAGAPIVLLVQRSPPLPWSSAVNGSGKAFNGIVILPHISSFSACLYLQTKTKY